MAHKFGVGSYTIHNPTECGHKIKGKSIHYQPSNPKEGKEIVETAGEAKVRKLIVPSRKPHDLIGIWPKAELERLMQRSHVVTMKEKMDALEESERKKQELAAASEMRKKKLAQAQLEQKPKADSKLAELDAEAKKRTAYLLKRALELRQEQEADVIKVNKLVLATKCHAIREAQMAEKELIKKELEDEEKRLTMLMERDRRIALMNAENHRKEVDERQTKFVAEITHQMRENEINRLMEQERTDEEARSLAKAMLALQKEEEKLELAKKKAQKEMMDDLCQANEDIMRYKIIKKEEERLQDLRIQEFNRMKMEREDARDKELAMQKQAKEREIIRMRELQQKQQDQKQRVEELNLMRAQEEMERKWRIKERDEARLKLQKEKEMHDSRIQQIEELKRMRALEMTRDEVEWNRIAKVQMEQYEKEVAELKMQQENAEHHRKCLLKQIQEKEQERINERRAVFEEGLAIRLQQELDARRTREVVIKKIKELRKTNMPECHIQDIERQLGVYVKRERDDAKEGPKRV